MLLGPRSRSHDGKTASGRGYYVFAPFVVGKDRIIVNRGFIPHALRNSKLRRNTADPCTIEGIARLGETNQLFGIANSPLKNQWVSINIDEMAAHVNATPALLEMTNRGNEAYTGLEFPHLRDPEFTMANNHLVYAITWFSLSIAGAVMIRRGRLGKSMNLFR